jgi:hypothetical protein
VKYGRDLVHSVVYCAVLFLVAPSADRSGDVVAWYGVGPEGEAERRFAAAGGDLVLQVGVSDVLEPQEMAAAGGRETVTYISRG